jgi:hypothetical protein
MFDEVFYPPHKSIPRFKNPTPISRSFRSIQIKMNSTNAGCSNVAPLTPPTTSPWCATLFDNSSALALQTCCNGGPVAQYNTEAPPCTFQYCNVTESAVKDNQTIFNCLAGLGHEIAACGNDKSKTSNAIGLEASKKLFLAAFVVGLVGAMVGVDMPF